MRVAALPVGAASAKSLEDLAAAQVDP